MEDKTEDFYRRLTEELAGSAEWPAEYLFKFIVPTENDKVATVENAFNGMGAVIKTSQSKAGKYTSISINVTMPGPEEIVNKYKELSAIEGIISL